MHPLDSPIWQTVSHAYGVASVPAMRDGHCIVSDIPSLLMRVYSCPYHGGPDMENVWQDLWSSLCHQGDIYTASIVALPHIVAAGLQTTCDDLDMSIFFLPISIEEARTKGNWRVDHLEIGAGYGDAIDGLRALKSRIHRESGDRLDSWLASSRRLLTQKRSEFLPPQQSVESIRGLFSSHG